MKKTYVSPLMVAGIVRAVWVAMSKTSQWGNLWN